MQPSLNHSLESRIQGWNLYKCQSLNLSCLGKTILHQAVQQRQTECVKWIIQQYPELAKVKTEGERSVLHDAAIIGYTNMVKILVWFRGGI